MGLFSKKREVDVPPALHQQRPPSLSVGRPTTKPRDVATRRHYALHEEIETARKRRDYGKAVAASLKAVENLAAFVVEARAEGRRHGSKDWVPPSYVSLDTLCQLLPARQDPEGLQHVRDIVRGIPELVRHGWVERIDEALSQVAVSEAILQLVAAEPGVIQSTLGKRLGADGRKTSQAIRWLEADGHLTRRASGKTYALHLTA